jgi:hypothetical protein
MFHSSTKFVALMKQVDNELVAAQQRVADHFKQLGCKVLSVITLFIHIKPEFDCLIILNRLQILHLKSFVSLLIFGHVWLLSR